MPPELNVVRYVNPKDLITLVDSGWLWLFDLKECPGMLEPQNGVLLVNTQSCVF